MSRFILIEQSLDRVGGHYHEYATEILKAAESAGYEPILATNARFEELQDFPERWQVHPVFPFGSTSIHRIPRVYTKTNDAAASIGSKLFRAVDGIVDRFKTSISRWRWLRHRSRINGFRDGCQRLFDQIGFQPDDQVLCSTMSDADFVALTQFLARRPKSSNANWHLQFHFSNFNGREPNYEEQMRNVVPLQRRLNRARATVPNHRLNFYTTTRHLAEQYNRLNVATFDELPWPVSERFHQADETKSPAKHKRLVTAGAVRREKGADHLRGLLEELSPLLDAGRVQLLFQTNQKRRSKAMLGLDENVVTQSASARPENLPSAPIVSVPHPLSPEDYAAYVKGADIGLLLYDADEYYVRCSGILVEFLSAGVPVIVPAGCWLGDQLAEANHRYLDQVADSPHVSAPLETTWLDDHTMDVVLPSDRETSDLLLRVDWKTDETLGTYLKCDVDQLDASGNIVHSCQSIVASRVGDSVPPVGIVHLEADAEQIRVQFRNAFHDASIEMTHVEIQLVCDPRGHVPTGTVGLTASGYDQIPRLIQEMVDHHDHYLRTAQAFAQDWNQTHAPIETVRKIESAAISQSLRQAG